MVASVRRRQGLLRVGHSQFQLALQWTHHRTPLNTYFTKGQNTAWQKEQRGKKSMRETPASTKVREVRGAPGTGAEIPRKGAAKRICNGLTSTSALRPAALLEGRGGRGVRNEGMRLSMGKSGEKCCFNIFVFVS